MDLSLKFSALTRQKNKLQQFLNERYRLVILHENSFEERTSFSGKLWYWISVSLTVCAAIVILAIFLIRMTPLREYVIGSYLSADQRGILVDAYVRLDSMERLVHAQDIYLRNLNNVISGNVGEAHETSLMVASPFSSPAEESRAPVQDMGVSEDEMVLRQLVESGAPYDLGDSRAGSSRAGIASYSFYSPVSGVVTSSFSAKEQHYAIDVAVKQNEPVRATLSGHVIFATYTPETGYVTIIQHTNNLLSVYKHCASIIKRMGDFVRGGEVIAFAGNTGELSTGPHLHFELWYNGQAVDPADYIVF